jgi:hypothetical protein
VDMLLIRQRSGPKHVATPRQRLAAEHVDRCRSTESPHDSFRRNQGCPSTRWVRALYPGAHVRQESGWQRPCRGWQVHPAGPLPNGQSASVYALAWRCARPHTTTF